MGWDPNTFYHVIFRFIVMIKRIWVPALLERDIVAILSIDWKEHESRQPLLTMLCFRAREEIERAYKRDKRNIASSPFWPKNKAPLSF